MSPFKELHFTEHDVRDGGSLALFVEDRSRCGIYWLDFEDGASYVGQSVNARTRLASHRRRWSDVTTARFAECRPERLDELELAVIQHVQKTRPLRNVLLTSRPGGLDDLIVTVREGASLALPWERERRGRLLEETVAPLSGRQMNASWERLRLHEDYSGLVSSLSTLLLESFPSPAQTQELLWTLTALPSTNRSAGWRRLCTLSAGRLEILRVFEETLNGRKALRWFLNLHPEASGRRVRSALAHVDAPNSTVRRVPYRAVSERVWTIDAVGLDSLDAVLKDEHVLNEVYRLVVMLMRQGMNPLRRHHNHQFATDVLRTSGTIPIES
jgi:hypothetical protein